jgi:hypothetical protein
MFFVQQLYQKSLITMHNQRVIIAERALVRWPGRVYVIVLGLFDRNRQNLLVDGRVYQIRSIQCGSL